LYNPQENTLYLATDNPLNLSIIDFLEKKTKKRIVLALADPKLIKKFIDLSYSQGLSPQVKEAMEEIQKEVPIVKQTGEVAVYEAPIAKIVTTILEYGVRSNASDIHIEPQEQNIRVRYRIDGILHEKLILPRAIHDALISRIKILSQMKIDEKRIPQDGRFNFKLGNDEQTDIMMKLNLNN
jgi:type IV pilus assembly protein PilB